MSTSPRKAGKLQAPTTVIVGENVYRLRVLRVPKLSQEALANKADVSPETIRLLERNRMPGAPQLSPHMDTVDKLAAALGVEPAKLFEQAATPSKPTGRRDRSHLQVVRGTGGDLPTTR